MKEIKLYLDLEKIEEETGRKFDSENEFTDNFLRYLQCEAWYFAHHNKNFTKEQEHKATELYDILKNAHSDWEIKLNGGLNNE